MALAGLVCALVLSPSAPIPARGPVSALGLFSIKPYLQLGPDAQLGGQKSLTVMWVAKAGAGKWSVVYGPDGGRSNLSAVPLPGMRRAYEPGTQVFRYRMTNLAPGQPIRYQVRLDGKEVFSAKTVAPKGATQSTRIAILGDSGRGLPGQKLLAKRLGKSGADLLVHVGDIVYPKGTESEYKQFHFPIYNADPGSAVGVPFLRSTVSVAAPGNHDTAFRNLTTTKGGLAYYWLWDQPVGYPIPDASTIATAKAGFENNPGNFSFGYGSSYWVVLDSNTYINWKSSVALKWLDSQLQRGIRYPWKCVVFHHAPFHSSEKKKNERYMTSILPLLTKHRVDLVFSGHVHNFQVSRPLKDVNGVAKMDTRFGGAGVTKADGTVFVVTGSGGAELYDQKIAKEQAKWKPFTEKYEQGYSYTLMDLAPTRLRLRQIRADGQSIYDQTFTK